MQYSWSPPQGSATDGSSSRCLLSPGTRHHTAACRAGMVSCGRWPQTMAQCHQRPCLPGHARSCPLQLSHHQQVPLSCVGAGWVVLWQGSWLRCRPLGLGCGAWGASMCSCAAPRYQHCCSSHQARWRLMAVLAFGVFVAAPVPRKGLGGGTGALRCPAFGALDKRSGYVAGGRGVMRVGIRRVSLSGSGCLGARYSVRQPTQQNSC
jgi:hypothetical protein